MINGANNQQLTFTSTEFAKLVKRKVRTLYTWRQDGRLVPRKDFSGRYIYTEDDYFFVMGRRYVDDYPQETGT